MSFEVIEFYARRKPLAKAFVDADRTEYTYLELSRDLNALIGKLSADLPRLSRMQPVAVSHRNRRLHLLMIFALEALGVTSLPFAEPIDPGFETTLSLCGLVLAEERIESVDRPFLALSPEWFKDAFSISTSRRDSAWWHADAVTVILTTSGSSGAAKAIPLHRSAFEMRERARIYQYGFSETSVFLMALPPSMFSIALSARATLRCGGTIAIWASDTPLDVLRQVTHATLLPGNLTYLLDRVPADYPPLSQLQLITVGAPLSKQLRERLAARLGARVENRYGSNELGGIMEIGADHIGDIVPGVDLEVVDDKFQLLPEGTPGMIRGRSQGMARRYVDQQQTDERFIDGWYLTGDYGVMRGYRRIELLGRTDQMLNLGGIKVAPERIEASLAEQHIARDLAVCSAEDSSGIALLHIVVAGVLCDAPTMQRRIQQSLSTTFGEVRVMMVDQIPRGGNGKLLRVALKELVLERLKAS